MVTQVIKMKIRFKYSITIVCLLNVGSITAQSKEIKQVEAAVEGLRQAMIHPTTASLDQYVMDELSYGHSGGKIEDKETFEANLLNGNSDFLDISLSNQTIKIYKKTAIVRHNLFAKTHDKGKEEGEVKLHIMTVWVKNKKQWKMIARQAIKH